MGKRNQFITMLHRIFFPVETVHSQTDFYQQFLMELTIKFPILKQEKLHGFISQATPTPGPQQSL